MKPLSILFVLLGLTFNVNAAISGENLLTEESVDIKPGKNGTVVVFMSAKCPCSNSHAGIMKKLAGEFADFSFVVVHSNSDEPLDLSKSYFKLVDFPFPVIEDEKGKLADQFKASRTPHAFLVSPDGKILYKGGVTNSTIGETADKQHLREALVDVSAGRTVKIDESRAVGCAISRGK